MEHDGIAAKRRKKLQRASVYAPFAPSCGYSAYPVCSLCPRPLSKLLQPVEIQQVDFFEQEKTEATELFFLRPLFLLCAPVQNFRADNHNKGN
jgi:hypothetical protein